MEKRVNLFVTEQGAKLKVSGERIFVVKNKETLADLPLIHLRQVVIFGSVTITPKGIARLLREGVFVTFLSKQGRFIGVLLPVEHADGIVRKMQVKRSEDESFRLVMSKEIISAKVHNSLWLLQKRRRKKVDMEKGIEGMKRLDGMISKVTSIKELLGLEGSLSREYFSLMGRLLNSEFPFDGRKKHPATDPLNALLSLSYTFLYSVCFSFLHVVGLDPYIGFYHEMRHGHASLASDLCEEFRAYICDSLIIKLINQGYFTRESFIYTGGRVFLTKEAMKLFLREWAKKLDEKVEVNGSFNTTVWHLIEHQAQNLKRAVLSGGGYEAFRARE